MSPRAACRLESLGFTAVYDYAAGKSDWTASGLPTEGTESEVPRPGALAREAATCLLTDSVATARERAGDDGVCIVTSDDGIVLGRLRQKALDGDADSIVEDVMEAGPTTVRYDESLPGLVDRMQKSSVSSILVSKPSGELVGVMQRTDAEKALTDQLEAQHEHHQH